MNSLYPSQRDITASAALRASASASANMLPSSMSAAALGANANGSGLNHHASSSSSSAAALLEESPAWQPLLLAGHRVVTRVALRDQHGRAWRGPSSLHAVIGALRYARRARCHRERER